MQLNTDSGNFGSTSIVGIGHGNKAAGVASFCIVYSLNSRRPPHSPSVYQTGSEKVFFL